MIRVGGQRKDNTFYVFPSFPPPQFTLTLVWITSCHGFIFIPLQSAGVGLLLWKEL